MCEVGPNTWGPHVEIILLSPLIGERSVQKEITTGLGRVVNCIDSCEPDCCCCQVDGGKEVASGFVVARCNGPELFELGKKILDQMACLVQSLVVRPLILPSAFRRDDCRLAGLG